MHLVFFNLSLSFIIIFSHVTGWEISQFLKPKTNKNLNSPHYWKSEIYMSRFTSLTTGELKYSMILWYPQPSAFWKYSPRGDTVSANYAVSKITQVFLLSANLHIPPLWWQQHLIAKCSTCILEEDEIIKKYYFLLQCVVLVDAIGKIGWVLWSVSWHWDIMTTCIYMCHWTEIILLSAKKKKPQFGLGK